MPARLRLLVIAFVGCVTCALPAAAQATDDPSARMIALNGHPMRVWTAGLESRQASQPVVILEAGGQGTVDGWRPVLDQISRVAPTLAYDRSGLGKSEYDGERPTVEHSTETLHALLAAVHVPPRYVLVGASWAAS
jgi:hypothetical protein